VIAADGVFPSVSTETSSLSVSKAIGLRHLIEFIITTVLESGPVSSSVVLVLGFLFVGDGDDDSTSTTWEQFVLRLQNPKRQDRMPTSETAYLVFLLVGCSFGR
jgi:hypothetical protein